MTTPPNPTKVPAAKPKTHCTPMAIKLAFSTVACPDWTLDRVFEQAEAMGYQGVELRTMGPGASGLACDPALSDPEKTARLAGDHGIELIMLSTSISLHHRSVSDIHAAKVELTRQLDLAAQLGCKAVRVFAHKITPGEDRNCVLQRVAESIKPIADKAGRLGVRILFENAGSITRAKHWWWLLNLVDHPMVGLCWNAANAAADGEPPIVSIPTLHSRIGVAKVKDTKLGEGSGFVPLGEGDVGIETLVARLLGVGFHGFVTVEWDRLWLPALAPADEYLPDAHQRLTGWLNEIEELAEKGRKAGEKAISRNAPKPPVTFAAR